MPSKSKPKRVPCSFCCIWRCTGCRWRRYGANPISTRHACPRCGSRKGEFLVAFHSFPHSHLIEDRENLSIRLERLNTAKDSA